MKFKGYIRVSSKSQEENTSLESQREAIKAYCNALNYELLDIVEEVGSGSNTTKRPKFNELVDSVLDGEADGIITTKLDRFARSLKDLTSIVDKLQSKGKGLICFNDNINTKDANSQLLMGILGSVAEWERKRINQRIQEGKNAKVEKTGLRVALGGKKSEVNPSPVSLVELESWKQDKKAGLSLRKIASKHNRHLSLIARNLKNAAA
jgi:site-specific DNA recombinase